MALRNVTITLDEDTARWARVEAAQHDMSVSRFVGELLRRAMLDDAAYDRAMVSFLARPPRPLKHAGAYPSRDELHDR